jgi:hypothetical protein
MELMEYSNGNRIPSSVKYRFFSLTRLKVAITLFFRLLV